jgi:eukaryotic-like serine/threonine-protein kinase
MTERHADDWAAALSEFDRIEALAPDDQEQALTALTPNVRSAVIAMLTASRSEGILDAAPMLVDPAAMSAPASLISGDQIGPFRIDHLIGRGGMGEVYLAQRAKASFDQRVALKLLRTDMAVDQRLFDRERRTLARLDHPAIAHFIDGGTTDQGRPWMAMAFVEGTALSDWVRAQNPPLRARLSLFQDICAAVAYAHANLIVHRDLKPSNILVDRDGRIRLLDFGIAMLIDDSDQRGATGGLLTLDYAAPEQLTGDGVTVATDVHALGLILHELLTGATPWGPDRGAMSVLVRRIVEDDIPPPSRAAQPAPWAIAPGQLEGDLDAIVQRALRKAPGDRYASVADMADDIARFLAYKPVRARIASRRYRLGRFIRRNRWQVAAAAALLATLTGGIAATSFQARQAEAQRDIAVAEVERSDSIIQTLTLMFAQSGYATDLTLRQTLDQTAQRLLQTLDSSERSGRTIAAISDIYINLQDAKASRDLLSAALKRGIGRDSPLATAQLEANLAEIEVATGNPDGAEALLKKAQTELLRDPAGNASVLEQIYSTRASIARLRGNLPEAIALISDLDRAEAAHAGNLTALLIRYNNLLVYLIEANRLADMKPIFARVEALNQKYDVRNTMQGIGIDQIRGAVLLRQNRLAEAERLILDVVDRRRRLYGDTPGLASDLSILARVQNLAGKYTEARTSAREARPLAARFLGEKALPTIGIDVTLIQIEAELGNIAEAQSLLTRLNATIAALPPSHPGVPLSQMAESVIALKQGDKPRAQRTLALARATFKKMGTSGVGGEQIAARIADRIAKMP